MSEKIDVWYNITPLSDNQVNLEILDEGISGTHFSIDDIKSQFEDFYDQLSSANILLNLNDLGKIIKYEAMTKEISPIKYSLHPEEKPLMFRNEDYMYILPSNNRLSFSLKGVVDSSKEELEKRLKRVYNNKNEY